MQWNKWLIENISAVETCPSQNVLQMSSRENMVLNTWAHLGFIERTESEVPIQLADDMSSLDANKSSMSRLSSPIDKMTTTILACMPHCSRSN